MILTDRRIYLRSFDKQRVFDYRTSCVQSQLEKVDRTDRYILTSPEQYFRQEDRLRPDPQRVESTWCQLSVSELSKTVVESTYNSTLEISWHCTPSNVHVSDPKVPSDSNTYWAKDSEDEEWARNPSSRAPYFPISAPSFHFTRKGRLTSAVPFRHTHCVTGRRKSSKGRGL